MSNNISWIENGSVSSPAGFSASGVTAGFKKSGAADCAMIYSQLPCNAAGAFTSCVFAAAPVHVCQEIIKKNTPVHACFINSGIANACTGENGMASARKTCELVASSLGIAPDEVLVSSTGRIGVQMPMDIVEKGVALAAAALNADGGVDASKAIMTTDTVNKSIALELTLPEGVIRIGAMTKGAGMIDPGMKVLHATMLCYITTDAAVSSQDLQNILDTNVEQSFNRITVDGDMSTNDTVILLANGASKIELKAGTESFELFRNAVLQVMQALARKMVMDGEGVTKFVNIEVKNAKSYDDAKKLAESVANSLLCKTAWFGCDPNWGRVVAALGYAKVDFNPDLVNIYYDGIPVVRNGGDAGTPESELASVMHKREFTILCDMNDGDVDYWVWTNDISYEYVKINADYHT